MSAYLSSPDDKDDAILKKQAFDPQIKPAELSQRVIVKSDYSLQNVDSQRNLHRLFAHAMDWA